MDIITDSYLDFESSSMHAADHDTTFIITEDWDIVQTQRQLLSVLNKLVNADAEMFRLTKSGVIIKQVIYFRKPSAHWLNWRVVSVSISSYIPRYSSSVRFLKPPV